MVIETYKSYINSINIDIPFLKKDFPLLKDGYDDKYVGNFIYQCNLPETKEEYKKNS